MRIEKNGYGEKLFERNRDHLPYEISFMHVIHAERKATLPMIQETLWLAWQPGNPISTPRRRPMTLRPTLSDGLPFSAYNRFNCLMIHRDLCKIL